MNNTEGGSAVSILLVEDDLLIQKVGKTILTHCGCFVDIAGNGREAVEAFARQRYDMIFMDCQMPVMDGYKATGMIRERENKNQGEGAVTRIPIVALTGFATQQDRERCLEVGMDDYLSKPFSVATVQSVLDRWLSARSVESREGRGAQASSGCTAGGPVRQEEPAPLDPKALDTIASLQPKGSDEILKKVIGLYLDSSCTLMKGIREAAEGSDADALHRTAHTLKSSSAYLGALTLSSMSKELEMMGRDRTPGEAMARLASLDHEYGRVRDALAKLLEGMTTGPNASR
jgi:CheY-like chemotaxis protein/HPt (histidine-containing phosphotransfer) domain-containing protein